MLEIETQRSLLMVSSVIKPRDEVSNTQDLLIPPSSNILEVYIIIFTFIRSYKTML